MSQISEYTFDKLVKYESNSVTELLTKLQIEINTLTKEIELRNSVGNPSNSWLYRAGTKAHFSNPKVRLDKEKSKFRLTTENSKNKLKTIQEEKQKVLINQSLNGIEHETVFIPSLKINLQKLSYESAPQKTLVPYGKQGQNIMGYASSDLSNYHNTNLQRLKENESRVTTAINEAKIDLTNKVESIKEERKQEKLKAQNELKRKQLEIVIPKTVIPKVVITDDIVIPKTVIPKVVIPEKNIVSSSALIPLGILAFLLINSRNNKK